MEWMGWAGPVAGATFGLAVIATTVAISPGILLAGLMSTDSGATDAVLPILVAVPFGLALGTWALVASRGT